MSQKPTKLSRAKNEVIQRRTDAQKEARILEAIHEALCGRTIAIIVGRSKIDWEKNVIRPLMYNLGINTKHSREIKLNEHFEECQGRITIITDHDSHKHRDKVFEFVYTIEPLNP